MTNDERERARAQARETLERQLLELFEVLFVRRENRRAGRHYSTVEAMVHDAHERPEEGRLAAARVSFVVVVVVGVVKFLHTREYIHEERRKREPR